MATITKIDVATLPIVDVDIHHTWKSDEDVVQYLPKEWRDVYRSRQVGFVAGQMSNQSDPAITPDLQHYPLHGGPIGRPELRPGGTGKPASDYEYFRQTHLDPMHVARAILSFDVGLQTAMRNPWLALAATRAANDWNRDYWLGIPDGRLRSVVLAQTHLPELAAEEILRVGRHPRIAEVLMLTSAMGKAFGHPNYDPIYRAAVEVGLPVAIHIGGEYTGDHAPVHAAGMPSSRMEMDVALHTPIHHHAMSMIVHGVFERFPELKVIMVETGVLWVPGLLAAMDVNYKRLRHETPWLRNLPSEYFRKHIKVATQPLEQIPARPLARIVDEFEMEDLLCLSTDYPHCDLDDPLAIARRLPNRMLPKLFYKNACEAYGWSADEVLREFSAAPSKSVQRPTV